MDTIDKIRKIVLDGQVLDDQGSWVPLVERKDIEKKVFDRLMAGKVLCQGRWVSIPQASETARREGLAPPQETKAISRRRAPKATC